MRRSVSIRLPVICLPLLFLLGCSQEPEGDEPAASAPASSEAPTSECQLTLGWDPWEPYQFQDAGGQVTGLDVEIAQAAADAAGCSLDFVQGQWTDMLNRLRTGDVDLLAGATPTEGRREFAEFTEPYRAESFTVFTLENKGDVLAITSLAELFDSAARIGTVAEYYYGEEISGLLDGVADAGRLHEAPVSELNYQRLLNGEIDAFLEDPFVASAILRSRGWGGRIVPTALNTATGEVSFMISRQSVTPEEIQRFRDGVQAIRDNGKLAEILERYRT